MAPNLEKLYFLHQRSDFFSAELRKNGVRLSVRVMQWMCPLQVDHLHEKVDSMSSVFIKALSGSVDVLLQVELFLFGRLLHSFCSEPLPLQIPDLILPLGEFRFIQGSAVHSE